MAIFLGWSRLFSSSSSFATYLLLRELPRRGAGDDDVGGVDALQRIAQRDHRLLVTAAAAAAAVEVVLPYTAGTAASSAAAVHLLFAVVEHVLEELLRGGEESPHRETKVSSRSKGERSVCVFDEE